MRQLEDIAREFKQSRPIFRLTKGEDREIIRVNTSNPVYKWRPTPEAGNILSELVCSFFDESFSVQHHCFHVDHDRIALSAMQEIRSDFAKFIEHNLEMRNPRQSKLYRWFYRSLPNGYDFNNDLVMVYKYLRSFCDTDMKGTNIDHTKNAIALLEAIMEKYNEE